MIYRFAVQGEPIVKARPRLGKSKTYTPKRTKDHQNNIAWTAKQQGVKILKGAVHVKLQFYMPLPITQNLRELALIGTHFHPCDIDNLSKAVLDALNCIAWEDDKQVVSLIAGKNWAIDIEPHTEIIIESNG